jgi:hypothetical protein
MTGWLTVKRRLYIAALAIELTAIGACVASAQMYSDAILSKKLNRVKANLTATVEVDIPKFVDPADKVKLRTFKAHLPLRGKAPLDLNFDGNTINIPAETLQYIDDLATLKAWLDKNQCDSDRLFPNYLHRMKVTPAKERKDPLTAFGLRSADLLLDPFVDNVSLKYYNSSVWFLIAHEIGHVAQGFKNSPSEAAAIAQEERADAFAIKVLRRARLNPAGIYLYFLATSFGEAFGGPNTHPTSAARIQAVATELKRDRSDFVALDSTTPSEDAQRILQIANSIGGIGFLLNKNQELREKVEKEKGPDKLVEIDAEVFPKIDFTRACPKGRRG